MRPLLRLARFGGGRRPFGAPPDPGGTDPNAIIIATNGNDSTGDGTLANPYRSLTGAVNHPAAPGDTIYMRDGYYDEVDVNAYLTGYPGSSIDLSGTEANPITVRSYPGEWAVIDGINHPWHPRTSGDGLADKDPRVLLVTGKWVNYSHFEVRNSVGGGMRAYVRDCKFEHMVFRNNHAEGLHLVGDRNEVAYCLFTDTNNISLNGNGGNGFLAQQVSESAFWGLEAPVLTEFNHIHHNVARLCSDDGFSTGNTYRNTVEYNVSLDSGQESGTAGMGTGFKMGRSSTVESGNVFRFNIAAGNRGSGFNTNTSQGVLCHNNVSYGDSVGFTLTANEEGGCANFGHNNIVHSQTSGTVRIVGPAGGWSCTGDPTTHTHNLGHPNAWADGTYGTNNLGVDPLVMSVDRASADFMRLTEASPARGAGATGTGFSTDLGAIPYGTEFAGGWDWRALLASFPSVRTWPMPQT